MKTIILIALLTFTLSAQAQGDKDVLKAVITKFVQAADAQKASELSSVLHSDFRIVMNQLFGSTEVALMDRKTYLQLVEEKKLGGDQRTIEFASIEIVNQNAAIKVILKGKTMVFESLIHAVKTKEGKWLLIDDLPYATKI
ncbi:MAG: nuclear transport factor 2 family protein [Cyclobacteriaceae bacterium]